MHRKLDIEQVQVDFLCDLSEGLRTGHVPRKKLAKLLDSCPAEIQSRLQAESDLVHTLYEIWPAGKAATIVLAQPFASSAEAHLAQ